jgi:hypothetical protein
MLSVIILVMRRMKSGARKNLLSIDSTFLPSLITKHKAEVYAPRWKKAVLTHQVILS